MALGKSLLEEDPVPFVKDEVMGVFETVLDGKRNNEDNFKGAIMRLNVRLEREKVLWQIKDSKQKSMVQITEGMFGQDMAPFLAKILLWSAVAGVTPNVLKEIKDSLLK